MSAKLKRPPVPKVGAPTAAAILEVIIDFPELHDQADWGDTGDPRMKVGEEYKCGTTHCVGGWAIWLHEGVVPEEYTFALDQRAASYLGLSDVADINHLFYDVTEAEAIRALRMLADGKPIDWAEVSYDKWGPGYGERSDEEA